MVMRRRRSRSTRRICLRRFLRRWGSIRTRNMTCRTFRRFIGLRIGRRSSARSWREKSIPPVGTPAALKTDRAYHVESEIVAVKAELIRTPQLPTAVLGLDVSDDAEHLYAACMDCGIYQVDARSGAAELLCRHESYASGGCIVPESTTLISSGYDGVLQWHDLSSGKTIRKVAAHKFWSWQSALSPDGRLFASVTGQYLAGGGKYEPAPETEPSVKVFDAQSGECLHALSHVPSVQAVAFSPDSKYVAAGNLMGEIRVWDLATGKQVAGWTTPAFTSWGIIKSHCYQGGVYSLPVKPKSHRV